MSAEHRQSVGGVQTVLGRQRASSSVRAAYTAMRTTNSALVHCQQHIARLQASVASINTATTNSTVASNNNTKNTVTSNTTNTNNTANTNTTNTNNTTNNAISRYSIKERTAQELAEIIHSLVAKTTQSTRDYKLIILVFTEDNVHIVHLTASPYTEQVPQNINVAVFQSARKNPSAKDTLWITDRRHIELIKPKDVQEVILCNQEHRITEGLVSNIFIVTQNPTTKAFQIECSELDSILVGTMLLSVQKVCAAENIPFILANPSLKQAGTWKGAFITSKYN